MHIINTVNILLTKLTYVQSQKTVTVYLKGKQLYRLFAFSREWRYRIKFTFTIFYSAGIDLSRQNLTSLDVRI